MKELTGDVWDFYGKENCIICIPTNGDIRSNGLWHWAIMGRGVAAQAKLRIPNIDSELGYQIWFFGNICLWLDNKKCLSFPVKKHWKWMADFNLIQQSRDELIKISESLPDHKFYLPRPGCGNGGLDYKDVRSLLLSLPDNVYVISFEEV